MLEKPPLPFKLPLPPLSGASRETGVREHAGSCCGTGQTSLLNFTTHWRAALLWAADLGPGPSRNGLPTRCRLLSGGPKWLIVRGSTG